MRNFNEVLIRLYELLGIIKDNEFCKKYDIKSNTLSTWKKRNSIPYDLISDISQNENLSLDYIINGKKEENVINFKEEIVKSLEKLTENDIKSIYHFTKSKEN